jgi:CheY-like chemotaxis protein
VPPSAKTKRQPQKTVLVVDDSVAVRAHVRKVFLSDGFKLCAEAENGLQALNVAAECHPDVIILDLAMPVMNGIDAAPKLKELLPHVPIILFTLHASCLKQQDLAELGISALVSKAASVEELLQKAHTLLQPRPVTSVC